MTDDETGRQINFREKWFLFEVEEWPLLSSLLIWSAYYNVNVLQTELYSGQRVNFHTTGSVNIKIGECIDVRPRRDLASRIWIY